MINVEALAAKNYPEECWINVYKFYNMNEYVYGMKMSSREAARKSSLGLPQYRVSLLYRIHVRLK